MENKFLLNSTGLMNPGYIGNEQVAKPFFVIHWMYWQHYDELFSSLRCSQLMLELL